MRIYREGDKRYIALELPMVFDIDDYMEVIGFKYNNKLGYCKDDMCIMIASDRFYCTKIEYNIDFLCEVETVCCHLNFIPDIWLINTLLTQIGFI
jgi:hypothetical protein